MTPPPLDLLVSPLDGGPLRLDGDELAGSGDERGITLYDSATLIGDVEIGERCVVAAGVALAYDDPAGT